MPVPSDSKPRVTVPDTVPADAVEKPSVIALLELPRDKLAHDVQISKGGRTLQSLRLKLLIAETDCVAGHMRIELRYPTGPKSAGVVAISSANFLETAQ